MRRSPALQADDVERPDRAPNPRSASSPTGWVIADAPGGREHALARPGSDRPRRSRRAARRASATGPTGAYSQRRSEPIRPIVAWPSATPTASWQLEAEPAPALGELPHAVAQREREPHRAAAGSVARQRVVEHDHQPVAGQPRQRPSAAVDQPAERRVVGVQHAHHVLRLGALGERREAVQRAGRAPRSRGGGLSSTDGSALTSSATCGGRKRCAGPRLKRLDLVVVALDPQQRAHAREQLGLVERLRHEVVGARLERAPLLLLAATR